MAGLGVLWEIVAWRCELNGGGDSHQKAKHGETTSITVAIYVKEIDFPLFLAPRILSLTLYLNPTCSSKQKVFVIIAR